MILIKPNKEKKHLAIILNQINGYEVSRVNRSIGTILNFNLGPLKKGEEEKLHPKHKGYLRIELCNWVLENNKKIVLTDKEPAETIDIAIKKLETKHLKAIRFNLDSNWPIKILFSDNYTLKVSNIWEAENWGITVGLPNETYVEITKDLLWRQISADHLDK